jgi:hypothetical protein
MSGTITSKSGNIDGLNVTAIAAIAPCVGGLIIWYAQSSVIAPEGAEHQDNDETTTRPYRFDSLSSSS